MTAELPTRSPPARPLGDCPAPCPPSCAADFDGDCTVGIADFLLSLANFD